MERSLLLFSLMVQIAYLIETVIYIFLKAYEYRPEIIKHSEFFDSNLGALTSNLFIVPAIAVLFATFHLGWLWMLVLIALLNGIELLFLKLHIYFLHWWRVPYTLIGLLLYFPSAKNLYLYLLRPLKGWLHSVYLFLCIAPFSGTLHILPIMFLMNRSYMPGWFSDIDQDTTAFSALYYLVGALIVVIVVKMKAKLWLKHLMLPVIFLAITLLLQMTGLLDIRAKWDPWYYALFPSAVFLIAMNISKRLSDGPTP